MCRVLIEVGPVAWSDEGANRLQVRLVIDEHGMETVIEGFGKRLPDSGHIACNRVWRSRYRILFGSACTVQIV